MIGRTTPIEEDIKEDEDEEEDDDDEEECDDGDEETEVSESFNSEPFGE